MRRYAVLLWQGVKRWRVGSWVLAVFFFAMCSIYAKRALPLAKNVSLVCKEPGITAGEVAQIRENEQETEGGRTFTAWSEKRQVVVSDAEGIRSVRTNVVEINGTSELLFPYGRVLNEEDGAGCLIGIETAKELFGSGDVIGVALCYGEREYTVRGILHTPAELLVVEGTEETDVFERITVGTREDRSKKFTGERFVSEYWLEAELLRYDLFSGERFAELIPGKWSDFSGWKENLEEFAEDFCRLVSTEKSGIEMVYWKWMCMTWGSMALGAFFSMRAVKLVVIKWQ